MTGINEKADVSKVQYVVDEACSHRFRLQKFFNDHYDELSPSFGQGWMDWIYLTKQFTKMGFRKADGSDLNPMSVQKMWWKVKSRHDKKREKEASQVRVVDEHVS